jgi:hypothetical protein
MNAVCFIRLLSFLPAIMQLGCKSSRSIGGWCSISSQIDSRSDDEAVIYSLVFEELKGVLRARLVNCAGREFYIGYLPEAKSSRVIPAGYRQGDMRWDGKLSCNDAQLAFPQDAIETKTLLLELCDAAEALSHSELQKINT